MKFTKKFLPAILTVMLLIATLPVQVFAATDVKATAGSTVTVPLSFSGVYGVQGTISFDNQGIIDTSTIAITISAPSGQKSVNNSDRKISYSPDNHNAVSGSVQVTFKVKDSAKVGDTCNVSITGLSATKNYTDEDWSTSTRLVIEAKPNDSGSGSGSGSGSSSKPSSKPSSSNKVDKTDYTELKKQIGIAEGLKADGYTKDSWSKGVAALDAARAALKSKDQKKVDETAQALKDAIAALVKVDYSKLEAAMDKAEALIESDKLGTLWDKLVDALTNASTLLASDDQAEVDAVAKEIEDIVAQIKELILNDKQDVVKEPTGKYCNVAIHKVWPILFFISLAGNIVLVVLLVGKKKKENQIDDTPIVNYEIGEDDK